MLSERALIEQVLAPLTHSGDGALGLRDDASLLTCPDGQDLVLTKDTLVSDGHFRAGDPPDLIARKALRVNLSDLAAKGARPYVYLLSLALTEAISGDWIRAFADGLAHDQEHFGIALHGGDTVRVPDRVVLSVTAVGTVPAGAMVRRDGAHEGDAIYVSGSIGDGALGLISGNDPGALAGLAPHHRADLEARFLIPQPRVELAQALREEANAAMDISDGLVGDLGLLVRASGVSAEVNAADVPLSDAAREAIAIRPDLFEKALTGGDDYEILCTVPPERTAAFERKAARAGIAVTRIGTIVDGRDPPLFSDRSGRPLAFARSSYAHF